MQWRWIIRCGKTSSGVQCSDKKAAYNDSRKDKNNKCKEANSSEVNKCQGATDDEDNSNAYSSTILAPK